MARNKLDRSSIFLFIIIAIVLCTVASFVIILMPNRVVDVLKTDKVLHVLFIFETNGKPSATELLLLHPPTGKYAIVDVPPEMGLVLKSAQKLARLDSVYQRPGATAYLNEVANFFDTTIPFAIVIQQENMREIADILGGLPIFIPSELTQYDPQKPDRALYKIPQGNSLLDGDKLLQYMNYREADEAPSKIADRRQNLLKALLGRLNTQQALLNDLTVYNSLTRRIQTNLSPTSLRSLLSILSKLDSNSLLVQPLSGNYQKVDSQEMFFLSHEDLVSELITRTEQKLTNTISTARIYSVEILNGTPIRGLAAHLADVYQNLGYDVVSVSNADRTDYDKTQIINYSDSEELGKAISSIIQGGEISAVGQANNFSPVDIRIILGADFNGRYVITRKESN